VPPMTPAEWPGRGLPGGRETPAMDVPLAAAMEAFQACIEARDRTAAEEVLDDEYQLLLVTPSRAVMPRHRWLEVLENYVVHDYVVEEQLVDEDDEIASVLHRVRMTATVLGEDRSGLFVLSDIWRKRQGQWRIWRRHSTPLSAGSMPGA